MLLLPSDWYVHGIRQSTKNRPIGVEALSIYTYLMLPLFITSPNFDNYIWTRLSSTQHSDTLKIWMCKDQKNHMDPLHDPRVLVYLPLPPSNSILPCLSLSKFCFLMLIALAWLATGVVEKIAANQPCWSSTQLIVLTMHPSTPSPPIELTPLTTVLQNALPNSSIAPFFRLPKPPHAPLFQTDLFHNCSSMLRHNSAPPLSLHAHLVAVVTLASLHSISHTHPAGLPMQW